MTYLWIYFYSQWGYCVRLYWNWREWLVNYLSIARTNITTDLDIPETGMVADRCIYILLCTIFVSQCSSMTTTLWDILYTCLLFIHFLNAVCKWKYVETVIVFFNDNQVLLMLFWWRMLNADFINPTFLDNPTIITPNESCNITRLWRHWITIRYLAKPSTSIIIVMYKNYSDLTTTNSQNLNCETAFLISNIQTTFAQCKKDLFENA